jgi:ribonucleoside-diphosphate reductase alpha chain
MGLADMMFHSGVPYGSSAGEEFAGQIMEFVRYHCMRTSIELARSRGPFPSVSGSIYDPEEATWQVPTPLEPYTQDWGRPELDWQAIVDGIRVHGVRNAAQTTVAPTGTIATVADCEGYGCEPAFALAYTRYMRDGQQVVPLLYTSPLFERALIEAGIQAERRREIAEQVSVTGSCRHVAAIPDHIRNVFVVAGDITPDQHVRMQAAIQAFVDNSISKTCNFPPEATEEDVKRAYFMAWKLGCKGLTVYVTGTREEVVLETEATRRAKQDARGNGQSAGLLPPESLAMPRPDVLKGMTYRVMTPHGKAFVTVNEGPDSEPFEVFMTVGKAGSDIFALSEALGRLISLVLRLPSTLGQRQKVSEIVNQLSGIGGRLSYGHGPRRVRSLPDGIAGVLGRYALRPDGDDGHQLSETVAAAARSTVVERNGGGAVQDDSSEFIIGDLCPDCGHTTLVRTEGCRKCVAHGCGYTEC